MRRNRDWVEDLRIDLSRLHLEIKDHSHKFGKIAKEWAKTKRKMREAEEKVKIIKSEWVLELKLNYEKYGFKKDPTAQQIEAFYRTREDYIKARKKLIALQSDVDDLWAAVQSFRDRREGLSDEQRLFHDEYWSLISLDPEPSEAFRRKEHEEALENGSNRIPIK